MTFEQAKHIRDKYKYLIGQKSKDAEGFIHDVIVVPSDNLAGFIHHYRLYMDETGNDEMLIHFPSSSYDVKVIYDTDPELVTLFTDDISLYFDRRSSTS